MAVHRLNHAVLYVRDVQRSVAFYADALGFAPTPGMARDSGGCLSTCPGSTNDHDLGLFAIGDAAGPSAAGRGTVGLYHLAWEVDTLADLAEIAERLTSLGALRGASDHSTTKALYAADPDGLEFEVCWLVPAVRIDADMLSARSRILPLDIDGEIARFGAKAQGGLGVSRPAPV